MAAQMASASEGLTRAPAPRLPADVQAKRAGRQALGGPLTMTVSKEGGRSGGSVEYALAQP